MIRVSSPNIGTLKTQQKVAFVTIGLVLGLILSTFLYFLFTEIMLSQRETSSKDSLADTLSFLDDTGAMFEQLATGETSSTLYSTSNLLEISENIQTLSTEELVSALRRSASLPYTRGLFPIQEMLCEYLVENSPSEALQSVWSFEKHRKLALLRIVFNSWADQNLEESFVVATGLGQPYKGIALETLLANVSATDEIRSFLQPSDYEEIEKIRAEQSYESEIYKTISQDPRAALNLLLKDDVEDSEQAGLFSQVFTEMFQLEGFDAITELNSLSYDGEFYKELLLEIVKQDRVGTISYLEKLSREQRSRALYAFMDDWVETDVESALLSVKSISNPNYRAHTYDVLVAAWGNTRPREMLDRLLEIPREHRSTAVSNAVSTLGETNPNEVLRRLSSLKAIPGAFNKHNERTFVYSWSSKNPDQALKWVQENVEPETIQRNWILGRVLSDYAVIQPEEAMAVAITEDPHPARGELGLSYSVIESLVSDDQINAAFDLLDQVPENNRASTFATVAAKLVTKDRLDDVISLADGLPAGDKVVYFRSVADKISFNNSSEVLTLVAKIPDAQLRSDVANRILTDTWSIEQYYTDEQSESLRSFVEE